MEEKRFYFMKDEFYEKFPDCHLMGNKSSDEDGQHNRPCYYCLNYENHHWMIPISSKLEKYERIFKNKVRRYKHYEGIKFGYVNGEKRAFLLQNIFPTVPEYIDKMYSVNKGTEPVILNQTFSEELRKSAQKLLRLHKNGVKVIFTNLDKMLCQLHEKNAD